MPDDPIARAKSDREFARKAAALAERVRARAEIVSRADRERRNRLRRSNEARFEGGDFEDDDAIWDEV